MIDEVVMELDPANPDPAAAIPVPTGRRVLKRDGVTALAQRW